MAKEELIAVKLPKENPDTVRASVELSEVDLYLVVDRRPEVNEWYIDMHVSPESRSIQAHKTVAQLKNHKKDYRWKHCMAVVASNNPKFGLPSCLDYHNDNSTKLKAS